MQELTPPGAALTSEWRKSVRKCSSSFTRKEDNSEAGGLRCFPKFVCGIKFQLPTDSLFGIVLSTGCPLVPVSLLSFLFWCSLRLPQGPLLREPCEREESSAVWKVEAYWRTLGVRLREKADVWSPVRLSNKPVQRDGRPGWWRAEKQGRIVEGPQLCSPNSNSNSPESRAYPLKKHLLLIC